MRKVIIYALIAVGVFALIIAKFGSCNAEQAATTAVDDAKEILTTSDDTELSEDEFDDEDGDYDIDDAETVASTSSTATEDDLTVVGNDDETDVVLATNTSGSTDVDASSTSTASAPTNVNTDAVGKFMVVTGSFRVKDNAEVLAKKLRTQGYSNAEVVIFDYSEFYSVVAGRSDSQTAANNLKEDLSSAGVESYVHKMRSKFYNK